LEKAIEGSIKAAKKIGAVLLRIPATAGVGAALMALPDEVELPRMVVPERTYEFPEVDVTGISDAGRRSMAQLAELRSPSATAGEAMETEVRRFFAREGFFPGGFRSAGITGLFGGDLPSVTTRARGGLVMRGRAYGVGEMGPELFVPQSNGEIIPNHRLGGGGDTYNITVQSGVGDPVRIGEEVVTAIKRYERVSGPVFASA